MRMADSSVVYCTGFATAGLLRSVTRQQQGLSLMVLMAASSKRRRGSSKRGASHVTVLHSPQASTRRQARIRCCGSGGSPRRLPEVNRCVGACMLLLLQRLRLRLLQPLRVSASDFSRGRSPHGQGASTPFDLMHHSDDVLVMLLQC